jgi:hypothetical protein
MICGESCDKKFDISSLTSHTHIIFNNILKADSYPSNMSARGPNMKYYNYLFLELFKFRLNKKFYFYFLKLELMLTNESQSRLIKVVM